MPANVDSATLIEYRAKGLSYADIAQLCETTPSAVSERLNRIDRLISSANDAAGLTERRAQVLAGLQAGLLAHVGDCLADESQRAKISPYQAVGMFGILYDKERLETGKSSSNVAILSGIINKSEQSGDSALRKLTVEPVKIKPIE